MVHSTDVYPSSMLRKTAIRIVKKVPEICGLPQFHINADFYMELIDDPHYLYETESEFIFYVEHLLLTDACLASCSFETGGKFDVAAILCEGKYLSFSEDNGVIRFNFEISGLTGITRTLYVHTLLREPGLTIRLEQNNPSRRAGPYREGKYPEQQILAANHYMFAMSEILKLMGIPEYLNANHLGYMLLLGFETNNEVHGDYPPHWHIIFRWPNHCGSQAPHLYLDESGAIVNNTCSIDRIHGFSRKYQTDEWCKFVDSYGRDLCALCVTKEGGLLVTKPNGDIYRMGAYSENGVTIYRNEQAIGTIHITNDTVNGEYIVKWFRGENDFAPTNYTRKIRYDYLTGAVISDSIITDVLPKS